MTEKTFNVLLDPLPKEWHGYPINSDFRIGIQITQCLEDKELSDLERRITACSLLFSDDSRRPDLEEAMEGVNWFLNEFNHDRHSKKSMGIKAMDFDTDQWRIYAAFKCQYKINLNRVSMHWFEFMGLLCNLDECSFTRVIDIRQKKITSKMSKEEKKSIIEAKKIYSLGSVEAPLTQEEKEREAEAVEIFNKMLHKGKN
ncbi:MAG: hypothetical protein J1E83_12635 [Lachnospiraceae bacterium]|nr:hypothetical protein [Lachnospiraceae bacterium]